MTGGALLNTLKTRSLVIQLTRDFFIGNGYLEVETPVRSPAVIPEAHIDPVTSEGFFLQASPELCMKRLLAMGAEKIFQICKCFRKGERGTHHLPELTLLEWYGTGDTYTDLMGQCEELFRHIAAGLGRDGTIRFQGIEILLAQPFDRLTVAQAFERYTETTAEAALAEGRFDECLSFDIEPQLGLSRPCFLYDYPAPLASLAKLHRENPGVAQRFELYAAGLELANGFTELTDAHTQKHRFKTENRMRSKQGLSPLPLPEKFLTALGRMPDAAGIALGMDRLVMLFCDTPSIGQVVAFPPESL